METINTCSICKNDIDIQTNPKTGIEIWAEGHNAEPVNSGRCCSDCNLSVVIPARLSLAGKKLRNTNTTIEEDDSEAWEAHLMLEKQRTRLLLLEAEAKAVDKIRTVLSKELRK